MTEETVVDEVENEQEVSQEKRMKDLWERMHTHMHNIAIEESLKLFVYSQNFVTGCKLIRNSLWITGWLFTFGYCDAIVKLVDYVGDGSNPGRVIMAIVSCAVSFVAWPWLLGNELKK